MHGSNNKSENFVQKALSHSPLFSGLSQTELEKIASFATETHKNKGQVIFQEGQAGDKLYIVGSGKVKIYRSAPDGREAILHIFGAGEPFGEVASFQGGIFPASAEVLEDAKIISIPRKALLDLLRDDPKLALNMLAAMSLRLKNFASKIEALSLQEVPQRLAAYILHESELHGSKDFFELDISKGMLAAVLGTARETLSRCTGRFVKEGVLAIEGREVRILDRTYLEDLARGLAAL